MKKLLSFKGRASRKEYWSLYCVCLGIAILIFIFDMIIAMKGHISLFSLVNVVLLYPQIATGVRRLHDINKAGTYIFIALIPIVGQVLLFIEYVTPGDEHANQYGVAPIKRSNNEENMSIESEDLNIQKTSEFEEEKKLWGIEKGNRYVYLLMFLAWIGAHKFYLKKTGMGILYFFTGGLFGIGIIIDIVIVMKGKVKNAEGHHIHISKGYRFFALILLVLLTMSWVFFVGYFYYSLKYLSGP